MTDIETLVALWSWAVLLFVAVPAGLAVWLFVRFLRA